MTTTQRPQRPQRPHQQQLALDHATRAGHLDPTTNTGRHTKQTHCPHCGLLTWTGDDDHTAALTATLDPHPLDTAGEALALATGRRTYTVHDPTSPNRWIRHRIGRGHTSHPAGPGHTGPSAQPLDPIEPYSVHAEHTCTWRSRLARQATRRTA